MLTTKRLHMNWPWKVNTLGSLQKMFREIGLDVPQYALMRELEARDGRDATAPAESA
jgi:hypothetical protein